MTTLLKTRDLNAYYSDVQVLYDVCIDVREGEIVVVVGANAAGKTTLINSISGLVKQTGSVVFDNASIDRLPPHQIASRGIVQVPEGRRLFPFMTVRENLDLGAYSKRARQGADTNRESVFALLPRVKERERQLAGSLSGGEQQMCAIGRALMAMPKLLMLDEPTLGLAPLLVTVVFDLVKEIRSRGMTILLVEQNVRQSLSIADRAYVLENGRIVMEGKGSDLLENEQLKQAYLGA